MKDFFGQSRADHRKGCPFRWERAAIIIMDKNRKKPRSIIPGGIRGKLSGKGSCRAGGVSRMREAEEELLSLEREDSAFSSSAEAHAGFRSGQSFRIRCKIGRQQLFYENGAHSGAIGRAGRTAGAVHTANGAAGARPSETQAHSPGISSEDHTPPGYHLAPYGRQRNN